MRSYTFGAGIKLAYLERRDRARIYAEILEIIRRASLRGEKAKITRIQNEVNVPFVRFKEYVDDLQKKGLIYYETDITLTVKGYKYLQEYERVRQFLENFGLVKGKSR